VQKTMSQLGAYGETQGFITLTPNGQGEVPRWDTTSGSDDLAFIGDLLDEAEQTMCVDTNRIFVTGLSNGAFMTSAIACAYADRIAAAAPIAGIRAIEGCEAADPVPVIAFHGTADTFVTYDGSLGESAAQLPAPDGSGRTLAEVGAVDPSAKGPTVPETTATWAQRNGCQTTSVEEPVASDVVLIRFDCPDGRDTLLYRVDGGGHTWPGSEFSKAIASVVGVTTDSVDANELMWEFFTQHPRQPG
jgi:polyhydroxybutyrate depolymerase